MQMEFSLLNGIFLGFLLEFLLRVLTSEPAAKSTSSEFIEEIIDDDGTVVAAAAAIAVERAPTHHTFYSRNLKRV